MRTRTSFGVWIGVALMSLGGGCQLILGLGGELPLETDGGAGGEGAVSCPNGARDGDETGKDCGGPACPACPDGEGCKVGGDCESKACSAGTCAAPSCADQIKNGDEIDVDCGGTCPKCGPSKACKVDEDCKSGACMNGACVSTCTDMVKGGSETDVDCGGGAASGCPACPNSGACGVGADCESGVCKVGVCVGDHVWSKGFSGVNIGNVALDGVGNAVLVGGLMGTANLGGGPLTDMGGSDVLVARFDAAGNHLWSKRFGDAQAQYASAVVVDGSSNVILSGAFQGTINWGAGVPITSAGGDDLFVTKLNSSGNYQWAKHFGDAKDQSGASVAVDAKDNVLLAGTFNGTMDFGGGQLTSVGNNDMFLAKLSPGTAHIWSKRFGDSGYQSSTGIAADSAGDVIVAGVFDGSIDLGNGALVSAGDSDAFVAKFDGAGNHLWSKRFGDDKYQSAGSIAVDTVGNVVMTGLFFGTINFGGGILPSAGNSDIFIAKFDAAGKHIWSKSFGDSNAQIPGDIAVDSANNILLTGRFNGTINFGANALLSAGGKDLFVAKFDASGKHLWSKRYGDNLDQYSAAVNVYDLENVLLAGGLKGTIDFGGGPLTGTTMSDIFLAKLRLP